MLAFPGLQTLSLQDKHSAIDRTWTKCGPDGLLSAFFLEQRLRYVSVSRGDVVVVAENSVSV